MAIDQIFPASSLSLRDLEYLVVLSETQHFGQAAKRCRVSQPSLSAQIKKVEDLLNAKLFERTSRRVALTEPGRLAVESAKLILEEARRMMRQSQTEGKPLSGPLRIGVIASLGPYYIPQVLTKLKKTYPDLQPILREGLTDPLLAELRRGELDVVLAAKTFNESGLSVYPLFFEEFRVATPKHHPLAGKKTVSISDLNTADMVLLEDGHCLKDQIVQLCPRGQRGDIRPFHAASLETIKYLVASGAGYTLLPAMATRGSSASNSLLEFRDLMASGSKTRLGRQIVLVCRNGYHRLRDVRELTSFLKTHAPQME